MFAISNIVAYAVMSVLNAYNNKKYSRKIGGGGDQDLAERYQLSENIRTSRQLSPVILLHLVATTIQTAVFLSMHYGFISWHPEVMLFFICTIYSVCNFVTQILVIT